MIKKSKGIKKGIIILLVVLLISTITPSVGFASERKGDPEPWSNKAVGRARAMQIKQQIFIWKSLMAEMKK